jgi:endonuclease/exonuclease/phosphatase family metal-dependent hydrolase
MNKYIKINRIIKFICITISLFLICCVFCSCVEFGDTKVTADNTTDETTRKIETTNKIETTEEGPKLRSLTVATYNIRHGADVAFDMGILADDLVAVGAEIVGLQEVDNLANRSGNIETMKLLAQKGGYEYYKFSKSINIAGGGYGTGILSKYPIVKYSTITLPSGKYEQRTYGHAVIDVNGVLIDFFNTHLSYEDTEIRTTQFKALADKIAKSEIFILTGDFNTNVFSEYSVIKNSISACHYTNNLKTFPSSDKSIDNILMSKNFELEKIDIGPTGHSDHRMLYAVIKY